MEFSPQEIRVGLSEKSPNSFLLKDLTSVEQVASFRKSSVRLPEDSKLSGLRIGDHAAGRDKRHQSW